MLQAYHGKKVLLVGGLGFIGSTLAHPLVELGAQVRILDNFQPDHGANWHNIGDIRDKVEVHVTDLRDQYALRQLIQDQDVIFNIAAQTSHSDSMVNPFEDLDINCRGNLILLEACRHFNPTARVVFVGTRAYYGSPEQTPVPENSPMHPRDIYSIHRYAAERYHFIYHLHYGLPVTALRISNIYGPYAQMAHPRYNVLNFFVRLALENRPIQIYGEGHQLRDYVYAADAAEALLLAGVHPDALGQVFNVGSGAGVPFRTLAETIVELAGQSRCEFVPWPEGALSYDVGDFIMDTTALHQTLGWQAQTSIREGLAQTIAFYRQHHPHYW
jgi:UDP-glucose 4-epimerase